MFKPKSTQELFKGDIKFCVSFIYRHTATNAWSTVFQTVEVWHRLPVDVNFMSCDCPTMAIGEKDNYILRSVAFTITSAGSMGHGMHHAHCLPQALNKSSKSKWCRNNYQFEWWAYTLEQCQRNPKQRLNLLFCFVEARKGEKDGCRHQQPQAQPQAQPRCVLMSCGLHIVHLQHLNNV